MTIIIFYVNIIKAILLLFAAIAQKAERIFEGDGLVKVRVLLAAPRGSKLRTSFLILFILVNIIAIALIFPPFYIDKLRFFV